MSIKKKCINTMCSELIPRRKSPPYCDDHQQSARKSNDKLYDRQRDPKVTAFYKSAAWRRFRLTVLAEYHYLCQHDQCNDIADTVHHEIEVSTVEGWSKRLNRSTVIPVCRSCHNLIHGRTRVIN